MQSNERVLAKAVAYPNKICKEATLNLFYVVYYIGKNTISFNRFTLLCELFVIFQACITEKLYHNKKSCTHMFLCISKIIQTKILHKVKNSKFFVICLMNQLILQ